MMILYIMIFIAKNYFECYAFAVILLLKGGAQLKKIVNSNTGAAAVEFAIVAPLLFVLLFGIIEFGALLYNQAVITNASREGARYAATFYTNPTNATLVRPDCGNIRGLIGNYIHVRLLNIAGPAFDPVVHITCESTPLSSYPNATAGYVDTVRIHYPYQFLVFGNLIGLLSGGGWLPTFPLTAQTVMRDENQS